MQCNEIRNYFADYLKEGLLGLEQAEFSQHLKECPACSTELEALTDIWVKVGSVPAGEPASPDLEVRFRAAVEESKQELNSKRRAGVAWWQRALVRAAAALLVLAVVLVPFLKSLVFPETVYSIVKTVDGSLYRVVDGKSQAVKVGERIDAGKILRTDEGAGAVLALPDGSRIEMHAKSELSLEHARDGVRINLSDGSVLVTPSKQRTENLYVQNRETTVPVTSTMFQSASPMPATAPQNPTEVESSSLRFEAASIKPDPQPPVGILRGAVRCQGADGGLSSPIWAASPAPLGRCVGRHVTLISIIGAAYDVSEGDGVSWGNISGGPDWAGSIRETFQIETTAEKPLTTTKAQLRQMLQTLLADRFKLKVRRETKQSEGYALVFARGGPKLKVVDGPEETLTVGSPGTGGGARGVPGPGGAKFLVAGKTSVSAFAAFLAGCPLGRLLVVDKTALAGRYEFNLTFSLSGSHGGPCFPDFDPPLPKVLEDQLGLRLEPQKIPEAVIVIEHAERPSEN